MSYKLAGVIWNDDGTMATKELTPLEALEELYHEREYTYAESVNHKSKKWANDIKHYDNIGDCLSIIETTLRDYKRVMAEKNDLFKRWAKEHQVLEIIKEKTKYSVEFDDSTKTIYIDCSLDCDNREYELLKEILK